ncbi:MAG TPA: four helix bundle protein [Cryomorphaceae bacterium]|nr:four helix bundle protein [Cryomorphaceae bacterium]
MFDFQKLEVYKKAKIFHSEIRGLIETKSLAYTEKDQLYRASFSIALNIAEGSGRFSKRDRKNFFVIARSSVFECIAILDILRDGLIISDVTYIEFENKADEISRMLYGLIRKME